jgi:hypothetical protein
LLHQINAKLGKGKSRDTIIDELELASDADMKLLDAEIAKALRRAS